MFSRKLVGTLAVIGAAAVAPAAGAAIDPDPEPSPNPMPGAVSICEALPPNAQPIVGNNGPNTLTGTPGPDVIIGNGGDDHIAAELTCDGGSGTNTIIDC